MAIGTYGEECVSLHRVAIHDRGGRRRVDRLVDIAEVEWNREEGQTTSARVVVSGESCRAQMSTLNEIAAHRHEVVIFRGDDRVWEGPLLEPRWYSNRVELAAHDVTEYLNTPLSKDWPNSDGGGPAYMTDRIAEIIEYELTQAYEMETNTGTVIVPRWEDLDPPANVLPFLEVRPSIGPSGILTRSSTLAFEMYVREHLQNLAEGGLEYTVIGRRLLIWDRAQSIGKTRPLTEADFYGELAVIAAGGEHAVIAHVSAQRDTEAEEGESGGVGNAGAADDFYGVWTRLVSLASEEGTDTPTQLELNSQARRQLVGRNPVPTQILIPQGGGLRLSHDLRINNLVPGVVMPVRATLNLRPVAQDQRLDKVTVKETPAGETIQVTLSPSGALEALG